VLYDTSHRGIGAGGLVHGRAQRREQVEQGFEQPARAGHDHDLAQRETLRGLDAAETEQLRELLGRIAGRSGKETTPEEERDLLG
jgi:hypothetical protein